MFHLPFRWRGVKSRRPYQESQDAQGFQDDGGLADNAKMMQIPATTAEGKDNGFKSTKIKQGRIHGHQLWTSGQELAARA